MIAKLDAPTGLFHCCCFSPNGRFVACGVDHTIYIWDITSPDAYLVKKLVEHSGDVWAIAFSTSSSLISGSRDGSVKIWQSSGFLSGLTIIGTSDSSGVAEAKAKDKLSGGNDEVSQHGSPITPPEPQQTEPSYPQAPDPYSVDSENSNTPTKNSSDIFEFPTSVQPHQLPHFDLSPGYQCSDQQGCLQGTQSTVLQSVKSWVKDLDGPPIFWLNGTTGAGKSAVVQTVANWGRECGLLGANFFCPGDDGNHRKFPPIILSLATQLAQQNPKVRSAFSPLLRSNPDIVYESTSDQVEELIIKPLASADTPTLIVIDGLDEWMDDASQSAILSTIESQAKKIPKTKFFITSRPTPHILSSFHLPLLNNLAEVLSLHGTASELTDNDIRVFLEYELSKLATQRGLDGWPTATQLDLLRDRAAGLFVYAVATIRFLDHPHTSPHEQYLVIQDSPNNTAHEGMVEGVHKGLSLDSLCISILQASFTSIEDNAIMRSILAAVALATRPLPPSVIAELILLEVEEVMSFLGTIRPLLILEENPDHPVRPFHKLLSDLLTSPTRCVEERFYVAPGRFHSEFALNCLKLMNETFDGPPPLKTPITDLAFPKRVALEYACASWHIHLAQSREDFAELISVLRPFLEEKFKVWLEVQTHLEPAIALNKAVFWLHEVRIDLF